MRSTTLCLWLTSLSASLLISCDDPDQTTGPLSQMDALVNEELIETEERERDSTETSQRLSVCGDLLVEGEEECDDGNLIDGDNCDSRCYIEVCGNGILQVGESCDEGSQNGDGADQCRENCRRASCGDGVTDTGEECDDGGENSNITANACRVDCKEPRCGDGVIDQNEECDEASLNSNTRPDACRKDCQSAHCGDGIIDGNEECDSGPNNSDVNADACRVSCVRPQCGDGVIDQGEECDLGDLLDGDGCSSQCMNEVGPRCGNGVLDPEEECDPGIVDSICRDTCTLPVCGDGIQDEDDVAAGFQCESSLTPSCVYNDQDCQICSDPSSQSPCILTVSDDYPRCGDGITQPQEECDDGDDVSGDGCEVDCRFSVEACGNGELQLEEGEECDDDNRLDGDGCSFDCRLECGDGVLIGREECDDGEGNGVLGLSDCDLGCTAAHYELIRGHSVHSGSIIQTDLDLSDEGNNATHEMLFDRLSFTVDDTSNLQLCLASAVDRTRAEDFDYYLSIEIYHLEDQTEDQTQVFSNLEFEHGECDEPTEDHSVTLERGQYVMYVKATQTQTPRELDGDGNPPREIEPGAPVDYSLQLDLTQNIPPINQALDPTRETTFRGRIAPGGDDIFRVSIETPSHVYLKTSPRGLGGCIFEDLPEELNAEQLDRPQLRVFRLEHQERVLFAQERPYTETPPQACSLYISPERWGVGEYEIEVRGAVGATVLDYVLDVETPQTCSDPQCGVEEEIIHHTYDRLNHIQESETQMDVYYFHVFGEHLEEQNLDLRSNLSSHLFGCVDGPNTRMKLWRINTIDHDRHIESMSEISFAHDGRLLTEIDSSSLGEDFAESQSCGDLSMKLETGNYALTIEGLSTPLFSLDDHQFIPFPYQLKTELWRDAQRGGSFEGALVVRSNQGALDEHGDDLYVIESDDPITFEVSLSSDQVDCEGPSSNLIMNLFLESSSFTKEGSSLVKSIDLVQDDVSTDDDPRYDEEDFDPDLSVFHSEPIFHSEPALRDGAHCVSKEVTLPAGRHTLRVTLTGTSGSDSSIRYQLDVKIPSLCGNSQLDGLEECDDGGRQDGDYCSSSCEKTSVCGDGILEERLGEQCDDGNLINFDGCSSMCTVCGNGIKDVDEECDPNDPTLGVDVDCDTFCTYSTYNLDDLPHLQSLTGSIPVEGEDHYQLTVQDQVWLKAQISGCDVSDEEDRFDTQLILKDSDGNTLRQNDDQDTSVCPVVTEYFDESSNIELVVDTYRSNEVTQYDLQVSQYHMLLVDEYGICNRSDEGDGDVESEPIPTSSCEEANLNNPVDNAPPLIYIQDELTRNMNEHRYKIQVDRGTRFTIELRKSAQHQLKSCPDLIGIIGFSDGPKRWQSTEHSNNADVCFISTELITNNYWEIGDYTLIIQYNTDEDGFLREDHYAPYELHVSVSPSKCNDGLLDADEACDNGVLNSDEEPNACRTDCTLPRCGDGVTDESEVCDQGGDNSDTTPNACRVNCQLPQCGDGIIDTDNGEECDDGGENSDTTPDACRSNCHSPQCGDGITDTENGEACDGGANCDEDCLVLFECEDGSYVALESDCPTFECEDGSYVALESDCPLDPNLCGNSILDQGETCDDGDRLSDDGCSANCRLERTYIKHGIQTIDPVETNHIHLYEITVDGPSTLKIKTLDKNSDNCETMDTVLTLYALDEEKHITYQIEENDDRSDTVLCSLMDIQIYSAGAYLIQVSRYGGGPINDYDYQLYTELIRDISNGTDEIRGSVERGGSDAYRIRLYDLEEKTAQIERTGEAGLKVKVAYPNEVIDDLLHYNMINPDHANSLSYVLNILETEINDDHPIIIELNKDTVLDNNTGFNLHDPTQPFHFTDERILIIESEEESNLPSITEYTLSMSPICGDGVLDNLSGEQCDDRGREDGDGCSSWCKVELNLCGNGIKEEGEACDGGHLLETQSLGELFTVEDGEEPQVSRAYAMIRVIDPFVIRESLVIDMAEINGDLNQYNPTTQEKTPYRFEFTQLDGPSELPFSTFDINAQVLADKINDHFEDLRLYKRGSELFLANSTEMSDHDDFDSYELLYDQPVVTAWTRGHEVYVIFKLGVGSTRVTITQNTLREGVNKVLITQPRLICDALCTFDTQRLSSTSDPNLDHLQSITNEKIPEGGSDLYLFQVHRESVFEAKTEGCLHFANNIDILESPERDDTVLQLYQIEAGEEIELFVGDDVADNACAQIIADDEGEPIELPIGSYKLVVSGYLGSEVSSYNLQFGVHQKISKINDIGNTFTPGLDLIVYDEFKEEVGSNLHRLDVGIKIEENQIQEDPVMTLIPISINYPEKSNLGTFYRFNYCIGEDYCTDCGNAEINEGEECDDGNSINHDTCTNKCKNNTYTYQPAEVNSEAVVAPEPDSNNPDDPVEVSIPLGDDQVVYIPFGQNDDLEDRTFTFFGKEYKGLYYSSNGFIQFVESANRYVSSGCCSGYPLPVSNRAIIGGYWSDLLGARAQQDYLVTINPFPTAPSYKYPDYLPKNSYQHFKTDEDEDILKLTWSNIIHYSDLYVSLYNAAAPFGAEKFNTFHIYLNFNTREVTIHCESCTTNGSPHTQGISFNSQFQYIPGRSSRSWSVTGDVVLFTSDAVEAEGESQVSSNNISCQSDINDPNGILSIENIVSIEDTDNRLTLQCIPTDENVENSPTKHIELQNSDNENIYYIKTSMIESP